MIAFYVISFFVTFLEATAIYVALTAIVIVLILDTANRLPYLSMILGVIGYRFGNTSVTLWHSQILSFAGTFYISYSVLKSPHLFPHNRKNHGAVVI